MLGLIVDVFTKTMNQNAADVKLNHYNFMYVALFMNHNEKVASEHSVVLLSFSGNQIFY